MLAKFHLQEGKELQMMVDNHIAYSNFKCLNGTVVRAMCKPEKHTDIVVLNRNVLAVPNRCCLSIPRKLQQTR